MKRAIVGLTAATLMGAGLVGVSAETADAVCPDTGCIHTAIDITVSPNPVRPGRSATICLVVSAEDGRQPRGHVQVSVTARSTSFRWLDNKRYRGRACFETPNLTRTGKYLVRAIFEPGAESEFGDSDNITAFFVSRR